MHALGTKLVLATAAVALALGAGGCSSSSGSEPSTGSKNDAGGGSKGDSGDAGGSSATFTEVYSTILQPTCSPCHSPGGLDKFMDFSSQTNAYAALVGVKASGPACGSSGDTRVVAGDAQSSLLFEKVASSSPPCGAQMPFEGAPISSDKVTLIEDWINAGAKND